LTEQQTQTQIGPDGKRHPVDELAQEQGGLPRTEGQIDSDGVRRDAEEVTEAATEAGEALAEEDPGRTLERHPAAFAGTQVGEDGIRRPLADVNPDAAAELEEQQAAKEERAEATEIEGVSDPSEVEAVNAVQATPQGSVSLPTSAEAAGVTENDRTGGGYEKATAPDAEDPRTVEQLKDEARNLEIHGFSSMNKGELVTAIAEAEAAKSAS
jgi:hypothetical protein